MYFGIIIVPWYWNKMGQNFSEMIDVHGDTSI